MQRPVKICFAASEAAPFAKTGGLADVASALPRQLQRADHDVRPFIPLYSTIDARAHELHPVDFLQNIPITLGPRTLSFSAWTGRLPGSELSFYFIGCPELFHRDRLYTSDPDEPLRFAFFSQAVLESCQRMGFSPDIIHSNDWHTGLLPLLQRTLYGWDGLFQNARSVMTIHNIGYQGVFGSHWIDELGLGAYRHMFDRGDLDAGRVNFLRSGLLHADVLTTVSPTYAGEIQTDEYGMGLAGLLRSRRHRLVGILNGVDYDEWSPERDAYIPHRYSLKSLDGKARNKSYFLDRAGLGGELGPPLAGIVSRLVDQKGLELYLPVLPELLATSDLRLAVLGTGDSRFEEFFWWLQGRFPGRVFYYRGYNEELAHLIEAASDLFLMPSRYEPCGLNQMFSLRYGTIPVVRRTGGLADSVRPFDPATGEGTGFVFDHFTPDGLHWALSSALRAYRLPATWRRLVENAMREDFSWERQSLRYLELYRWLRDL